MRLLRPLLYPERKNNDDLSLADHLLYESSRIGTETSDKLLTARIFTLTGGSLESAGDITEVSLTYQSFNWTQRKVKDKSYELSNGTTSATVFI